MTLGSKTSNLKFILRLSRKSVLACISYMYVFQFEVLWKRVVAKKSNTDFKYYKCNIISNYVYLGVTDWENWPQFSASGVLCKRNLSSNKFVRMQICLAGVSRLKQNGRMKLHWNPFFIITFHVISCLLWSCYKGPIY